MINDKGKEKMNNKKNISDAVIRRLPRYYRYIGELKKNNIHRISSKELSEKMSITASQIRQDFSCFGGFGQQGLGYRVDYLYDELNKILGTDKGFNIIIIGAGNLGRALANYERIKNRGIKIIGVFDKNPNVIGTEVCGLTVLSIENICEFVNNNKVDIATLTVPRDQVKPMADLVVGCGIKGLWNFSAKELVVPEHVVVENVHLSDSIMVLGYKIIQKAEGAQNEKL